MEKYSPHRIGDREAGERGGPPQAPRHARHPRGQPELLPQVGEGTSWGQDRAPVPAQASERKKEEKSVIMIPARIMQ